MADGRVEDEDPASPRSCISDCESSVSGPVHGSSRHHIKPVKRLDVDDHEYVLLKHRLYSSLGPFSKHCHIVAAYKNTYSTNSATTRLEAFEFSSKCMMEMRGGDPNIKYAWYGTSRDGVGHVICNGFSSPENAGPFGQGLYLSPENHAVKGIATSTVDRHGIRHMLLCKVILGRSEQILLGSKQSLPSSLEFDSGVDDQMHPKWYIIWNEQVKTHILPMYVISIKLELPIKGQEANHIKKPTSPWVPLGTLVSMLSHCLPSDRVSLIKRFHNAYVERKLTRVQLIHRIRKLSGDRLLLIAIKAFQDKVLLAGGAKRLKVVAFSMATLTSITTSATISTSMAMTSTLTSIATLEARSTSLATSVATSTPTSTSAASLTVTITSTTTLTSSMTSAVTSTSTSTSTVTSTLTATSTTRLTSATTTTTTLTKFFVIYVNVSSFFSESSHCHWQLVNMCLSFCCISQSLVNVTCGV